MCGRYVRRQDNKSIAKHYGVRDVDYSPDDPAHHFAPDYNVTPDSFQPVVRLSRETGEREIAVMKWGWFRSGLRLPSEHIS